MVNFLTLDKTGIVLAVIFGALILFLGQGYGYFFLLQMLIFLAISALVTRMGVGQKRRLGVYEKTRGWKNVVANGLVPLAVSFAYFLDSARYFFPKSFVVAVYVASVAAISADKFASEVGMLDRGTPVMLLTLKKAKKGTSGAVSILGTTAAAVASLLISSSVLTIGGSLQLAAVIAFSGFFGEVVDSAAGYFEEQGIGNKFTSNFLCSLAGALTCAYILVHFAA